MPLKRRLKILNCNIKNTSIEETVQAEPAFKVAFASKDMKHVNQHFGSAESFIIYLVYQGHSKILEVMQFGELAHDGNEDKLMLKMSALEGCIAVYFQAIGTSAVRQLNARSIQPIKVSTGTRIAELLESIQEGLLNGSVPWLVRAIESQKPADSKRFDDMESEGWNE